MSALVIGGVTAKAADFARLPDERGGGGLVRTLSGQLRGRSDWTKRGWSGTLLAEDDTELAALLAVLDPDANVTISGDLIGASVSVRAEVTGDTSYARSVSGGVAYYLVPVALREV